MEKKIRLSPGLRVGPAVHVVAGGAQPRPAAHAVRARQPHLRAHLLLLGPALSLDI